MKTVGKRLTLLWLSGLAVLTGCAQTNPPTNARYDAELVFGYDKTLPLSPQESVLQETAQFTVYKVTYRSARDQRVPALLILPKNRKEDERLPCVMLMHGLGSDKRMFEMLWPLLTQQGYALFAIDAQYHGERKPNDDIPFFGPYPYRARDALIQTVIDLRRGLDYLETRKEIDPKRIGYIGASMGGILGSMFAGVDERVQAPVLLVAGGNWRILMERSTLSMWRDASKQNAQLMEQALQAMDVVDPVHWVGRISPRPVLFINGDADDVVPVDSNKALQNAAREPKTIVWYKGGHVPPPNEMMNVFGQITNWLNTHLKGSKSASTSWRTWVPRSWDEARALWQTYRPILSRWVAVWSRALQALVANSLR